MKKNNLFIIMHIILCLSMEKIQNKKLQSEFWEGKNLNWIIFHNGFALALNKEPEEELQANHTSH